ncbi:uncharacterized protein [Rutidosis leptorrhynchoides]|uniref:uncharacterized protein n=1 Tax=Rutidosis leptorrhynchoides TaxID=125765 RepID=UPI003A9A0ED1
METYESLGKSLVVPASSYCHIPRCVNFLLQLSPKFIIHEADTVFILNKMLTADDDAISRIKYPIYIKLLLLLGLLVNTLLCRLTFDGCRSIVCLLLFILQVSLPWFLDVIGEVLLLCCCHMYIFFFLCNFTMYVSLCI